MLGFAAISETAISEVPGTFVPPATTSAGAPHAGLIPLPLDFLALVHADDDDALLTAF